MNTRYILAAVSAVAMGIAASAAHAGSIPYPNTGTQNPDVYTFAATATGNVTAYFYGSDAAYDETLGLLINGVSTGITGLANHGTPVGQSLVLGTANAGDILTFVDYVSTTNSTWYSNPVLNADSANHIYATAYPGDGLPAGIFAAFEDIAVPGADLDYNDTSFILTNVSPVPLPGTLSLFGAAFAGLIGFGMRKARRAKTA